MPHHALAVHGEPDAALGGDGVVAGAEGDMGVGAGAVVAGGVEAAVAGLVVVGERGEAGGGEVDVHAAFVGDVAQAADEAGGFQALEQRRERAGVA